jgi:hypothetical protein
LTRLPSPSGKKFSQLSSAGDLHYLTFVVAIIIYESQELGSLLCRSMAIGLCPLVRCTQSSAKPA